MNNIKTVVDEINHLKKINKELEKASREVLEAIAQGNPLGFLDKRIMNLFNAVKKSERGYK